MKRQASRPDLRHSLERPSKTMRRTVAPIDTMAPGFADVFIYILSMLDIQSLDHFKSVSKEHHAFVSDNNIFKILVDKHFSEVAYPGFLDYMEYRYTSRASNAVAQMIHIGMLEVTGTHYYKKVIFMHDIFACSGRDKENFLEKVEQCMDSALFYFRFDRAPFAPYNNLFAFLILLFSIKIRYGYGDVFFGVNQKFIDEMAYTSSEYNSKGDSTSSILHKRGGILDRYLRTCDSSLLGFTEANFCKADSKYIWGLEAKWRADFDRMDLPNDEEALFFIYRIVHLIYFLFDGLHTFVLDSPYRFENCVFHGTSSNYDAMQQISTRIIHRQPNTGSITPLSRFSVDEYPRMMPPFEPIWSLSVYQSSTGPIVGSYPQAIAYLLGYTRIYVGTDKVNEISDKDMYLCRRISYQFLLTVYIFGSHQKLLKTIRQLTFPEDYYSQ